MAEDLSKRKKVGDVYRSGSFAKAKKKGLKVSDLKKSQLKRAQTVRGKTITARQVKRATNVANKTNISDTSFVKGQGVMKNGKLLTGSVTLASGKTAQYVKGRRVAAGPKKTSTGGGGGKTTLTRGQKAAGARYTAMAEDPRRFAPKTVTTTKKTPPKTFSGSSIPKNAPSSKNIPYGGTKKPFAGMIGPGQVGVRLPKDGGLYRFGPPNNIETYRWDAKNKKFVKSK